MTSHTPTSIKNNGGPPPPALRQPGVSAWGLIAKEGPRLLMLLVLAASVWLAIAQFTPPAVVPASAPATEFSAERAMTDLRAIAQKPHPMGTSANAEVRTYLLKQMRAIGLTPEVQTTSVVQHWTGHDNYWAATVNNVVVRLRGTANTRAILLDAHYDSAATAREPVTMVRQS